MIGQQVLETKTESKSTALVLAPEQNKADRKRTLFVKVLKQEFLHELHYLWDVANDRAQARDTFTSKLVSQLKELASYTPIPMIDTIMDKLGSVAEFSGNNERDQRTAFVANLMDELDLGRLEILLDVVAREALRRYENFIVDRLSDTPEEGVIPFAKIGARRMLEKLSRSGKQLAKGIGVNLSEASLLAGLVEGRSGSFVEGWSNHKIKLNNKYTKKKAITGKVVVKEVEVEDAYARPGFCDFAIRDAKKVDTLYARQKAWHKEQPGWDKFKGLLKGDKEAFYNFGYVRFRKEKSTKQDPKLGYMVMPLSVIEKRYDFKPQEMKELSAALQEEVKSATHSIIAIDRETVKAYLEFCKTREKLTLLDYVRVSLGYPSVEWVECHDSLEGLDLRSKNLGHCDFSGAIFDGDLIDTNFSHCYLIGAVFKNVKNAQGAIFVNAKAAFLQAEEVDLTGADLTQADFSYANFRNAKLINCKTLGTLWKQADLRGVTEQMVALESQAQNESVMREVYEQRQTIRALHAEVIERTQGLYQMQQELRQQVGGLTHEKDRAITTELQTQLQQLIEQQSARQSVEQLYRQELAVLNERFSATADKKQLAELHNQIQILQDELKQLKDPTTSQQAIAQFRDEVKIQLNELTADSAAFKKKWPELEAQLRNELAAGLKAQEIRLNDLEQQVKTLYAQLDQRLKQLENRVDNIEKWAADTRTQISALQSGDKATQENVKALQQRLDAALTEQAAQTQQQLQAQSRLQVLERQIKSADRLEDILSLRKECELLQDQIVFLAKSDSGVKAAEAVAQNLKAFEKTAGAEHAALQQQIQSWQTKWQAALETQAKIQKAELAQLRSQIDEVTHSLAERMRMLEARVNVLEAGLKEMKESKNEEMDKIQAELKKCVSGHHALHEQHVQYQKELLDLKRQAQQSADADSLKKVQADVQRVATRIDQLAPLSALQKVQAELDKLAKNVADEQAGNEQLLQKMAKGTASHQALQAEVQQTQQQLADVQRLQQLTAKQLAAQQQAQKELQLQVGQLENNLTSRLSAVEQRVTVLESLIGQMDVTYKQDMQKLLAEKQKDGQRQVIYQKQLQGLRTQIQAAASNEEVKALSAELESVKAKLESGVSLAEFKHITEHFAKLEQSVAAEKLAIARLEKKGTLQRDQIQAMVDQLQKEAVQVSTWQAFVADEQRERAQLSEACKKAGEACDQRVAVLEGRVTVLETFVSDLRQGFGEIKYEQKEFKTKIETKLMALETDLVGLRARDQAFLAERQRYEKLLDDYQTQISAARNEKDEKAMQTLQAQVVALEHKLAEPRTPVIDRELLNKLQSLQTNYGQLRQQLQQQAKTNSQLRHQMQTTIEQCASNEQRLVEMQSQTQTLFTQHAKKCQEQIAAIKSKVDELVRLRPEYTVAEKLKTLRERVLADPEFKDSRAHAIRIEGQTDPDAHARGDLATWVKQELVESKSVEMGVVIGDAGCGKSTFLRQMELAFWQALELKPVSMDQPATENYIPIYIPLGLPWVEPSNVWSYLKKNTHYRLRFSDEEIFVLQKQYRVLLLADGYEQLREPQNLHFANGIHDYQGRVKLLVACRFERFQELNESRWFMPRTESAAALYRKRFVSVLNEKQMSDYVKDHASAEKAAIIQSYLASNPELKQLLCYPSLLQVALEVLPEWGASGSTVSLTRKRLLDTFVNRWFEQKKQQLEATGQLPELRDIKKLFYQFCQAFAHGLDKAGVTSVKYPFTNDHDEDSAYEPDMSNQQGPKGPWVKKLFGGNTHALERNASPLKASPQSDHQFLHASLKDYFVAISDTQTATEVKLPAPAITQTLSVTPVDVLEEFKRKSPIADKKPSLPTPAPAELPVTDTTLALLKRGLLPHEQIHLLVDRIQEEPEFSDYLFQLIEASKQDEQWATAASNAVTILNAAGIDLSNRDWSGIHLDGADLSGSVLDGTQFTGATLHNVNLQGAWLRHADFSRASFDNLRLGEWPYITTSNAVVQSSYAPNGKWLVIACANQLNLFDAEDYRLLNQWDAHDKLINQFAFNAQSTQLVSAGTDQTVRIWQTENATLLHQFAQTSPLLKSPSSDLDEEEAADQMNWPLSVSNSVVFHPQQNKIASAGLEGQVEIYDLATAKVDKLTAGESKGTKPGRQQIQSLSWNGSGRYLAAGRINRDVSLWDMQTNQLQTLRDHSHTVDVVSFHPQGHYLVTGGSDKILRSWDVATGKVVQRFEGHRGAVTSLSFDPSGERFVTGSNDKTVILWETNSGQILRQWRGHTEAVKSVGFRPDGRHVASGSDDKTVRIWEANSRRELRSGKGHRQEVEALAHDAKNNRLYSASSDGAIRIWDAAGRSQGSIATPSATITGLALDTTRGLLYASSWDRTIRIWDAKTHKQEAEHKTSTLVNHLALDAKGERLAWGGLDGKVRLCEAGTLKVLQEYKGPTDQIYHLAFDATGEYLAAASGDSEVSVWNTKTHKRTVLTGHTATISDLCFVAGRPWLFSTSWDNSLRLWDLRVPDDAVRLYAGHTQAVTALAVDPSGNYLLSASDDKTLRLWDINQEKSLATWPLPYAAKTLVWRKEGDTNQLIIGAGALVICFNLHIANHQFDLKLAWQAGTPSLFAEGASVDKSRGLTHHQARLFSQRGAAGIPLEVKARETKEVKESKTTAIFKS